MKKFIVMGVAALVAASASASITFDLWFNGVEDSTGSDLAEGTLFAIVNDVDADGLDQIGTDGLAAGDDEVVWTYQVDSGYPGEIYFWESNIDYPSVSEGDNFYLVWYEGTTDDSATSVAEGSTYSYYRESDFEFGADGSTLVYANNETIDMSAVTTVQAIPEPATMSLLAIAGLGAFFNRRRLFNK